MEIDDVAGRSIEIKIRQSLIGELHDLLGRLRNLGATAQDVLVNGSTDDWKVFLATVEPEVEAISHDILHVIAPFVYEERPKPTFSPAEAFREHILGLGTRFSSSSRKVFVDCDTAVCMLLTPRQCLSINTIVENCISNAARHARASTVQVALTKHVADSDGGFELNITDNGVGNEGLNDISTFVQKLPVDKHLGLRKLLREVEKLGANLSSRSGNGVGTMIRITIPFQLA